MPAILAATMDTLSIGTSKPRDGQREVTIEGTDAKSEFESALALATTEPQPDSTDTQVDAPTTDVTSEALETAVVTEPLVAAGAAVLGSPNQSVEGLATLESNGHSKRKAHQNVLASEQLSTPSLEDPNGVATASRLAESSEQQLRQSPLLDNPFAEATKSDALPVTNQNSTQTPNTQSDANHLPTDRSLTEQAAIVTESASETSDTDAASAAQESPKPSTETTVRGPNAEDRLSEGLDSNQTTDGVETSPTRPVAPNNQNATLEMSSEVVAQPATQIDQSTTTSTADLRATSVELQKTTPSQVTDHIVAARQSLSNGKAQLEVMLDPPELGRVVIELTEVNDKLSARIVVAEQATLDTIRSSIPGILESLADAGVGLDSFQLASSDPQDGNHRESQDNVDDVASTTEAEVSSIQTTPVGGRASVDILV